MITSYEDRVPIYDYEYAYFDDWLKAEYGADWDDIREDMLVNGDDDDTIEEHRQELEDEFYTWCENYSLTGETA